MRVRMRFFAFAAVLLLSSSVFANDEKVRAFEQFVEQAMKAQKMTGLSVAVVHGDFRWSRGFGFADVENEVPARPDSSYRMGSVTKPMTAVAVLKLVDEGKIDLDAEVQTYVPYFPRKSKPVTVRQLLMHQGGISHYRDYAKEGHIREPKTTREAIAIFEDFDLVAEPGTAYRYTTYGYNLLGAVIEGASGKSYAEYMTENVWKPLGMTATRMDDPRALVPHRVTGYVIEGGVLRRSEYIDISSRFAGGGTRSTVEDMLRFVEGIAAGKVLKDETRNAAWTAQPTRDGRYTEYGHGFGVDNAYGRWIVVHSGAQQETRTLLAIVPSERFAFALATNFENANLRAFDEALFEIFLGDPRSVEASGDDDSTQNTWRAMDAAWRNGLAYYDRWHRPMTTDARQLSEAFAYFRRARTDATLSADGVHRPAGEPLTKLGSYMASVLAAKGDLDVYHHEGALRFFADYATSNPQRSFDRAFVRNVRAWLAEWNGVLTPELRRADLATEEGRAVLERSRDRLASAPLKPDYSRVLVSQAEDAVEAGDVAGATRIANLGYAIYPKSPSVTGVLGVLSLVNGDSARAKTLLATSLARDPRGYARAGNLLEIANFLGRSSRPLAVSILELATELHPSDEKLRARLEEMKKN